MQTKFVTNEIMAIQCEKWLRTNNLLHNSFVREMRKSFALKFRKTKIQLKNIWEEGKYEHEKRLTVKYLSKENTGIAESSIGHHLPA